MLEGMPRNINESSALPEISAEIHQGATQISEITSNSFTPPPLYYNIHLSHNQPSVSGVSDRGAPPSYEEAIDPNGLYFHLIRYLYLKKLFNILLKHHPNY